jgi:hypothetical protein
MCLTSSYVRGFCAYGKQLSVCKRIKFECVRRISPCVCVVSKSERRADLSSNI